MTLHLKYLEVIVVVIIGEVRQKNDPYLSFRQN